MRFKNKNRDNLGKTCSVTRFAIFPITVNGETRWLENVTIEGYYYIGCVTNMVRFMEQRFIN